MALGNTGGLLVISLDVDGVEPNTQGTKSEVETACRRVLDVFEQRRVPATFAMAMPGASKLSEAILGSRQMHEIAILGDSTWIGPKAGRTRFARELAWRVRRGNEAGIPIATLALRDVSLDEHLDLLVKHNISTIREANVVAENASRVIRPQLFRYGIWKATASCRLPSSGKFWMGADALVGGAIKRAAFHDEIVHLSIDVSQLADDTHATLKALDRILHRAEPYREMGRLAACTLSAAVAELSRVETTRRSHSVLRAA